MSRSKTRTAVTMSVLGVILVVMLAVGWNSATASFPSLKGTKAAKATCTKEKVTKRIFRKDITVSVYNGTKRKGFADDTLSALEAHGFRVGALGNASKDETAKGVQVLSVIKDDPRATLVARQFKPVATVRAVENLQGPGINVIMGPKSHKPLAKGPPSLKLAKPAVTCLDDTAK